MDIQFDHTIVKVNKDGHVVMGNSLSKGEKLISGETYAEAQKRLGGETVGIPAAQEVVTVEAEPLTLDPSQTSTVPAVETVTVENTSTAAPENTEQEKNDDGQTGVRPDDSDPKSVWFEYALGKGHKGEYDDITKKQLIEQYGD